MGDRVKVIEVDVDRNQAAASRYQVRSVPTLMLFKRGKVVWNHSGVAPVHTLQKAVAPHVA